MHILGVKPYWSNSYCIAFSPGLLSLGEGYSRDVRPEEPAGFGFRLFWAGPAVFGFGLIRGLGVIAGLTAEKAEYKSHKKF